MAMVDILPDKPFQTPEPLQTNDFRVPSPKRNTRHTKGLSLNVPILLSSHNLQSLQSPVQSLTSSESATTSPQLRALPINENAKSVNRSSADFLTLLAAQERKVLELKEELQKAETDLTTLKKSWASHETSKKREESKRAKKLQPLALEDFSSLTHTSVVDGGVDEERRRRRALVERSNNVNGATSTNTVAVGVTPATKLGRKGSKRVFEGRHTRTLSLLSPTMSQQPNSINSPTPEAATGSDENKATGSRIDEILALEDFRPSPFRMTGLDTIITKDGLQIDFGKAYKDLAAHRRSLPHADLLVKQGKQMVDGVRDGFWTFVEDIRQATVGEEGINGTEQRPARSKSTLNQNPKPKLLQQKGDIKFRSKEEELKKEDSFWREFGLETPQKKAALNRSFEGSHGSKKNSTDSASPPDLMIDDIEGHTGEEDHWETWDSPQSTRNSAIQIEKPDYTSKVLEGEDLPWPTIEKPTPSKLTRTVSDLMREWDAEQNPEDEFTTGNSVI